MAQQPKVGASRRDFLKTGAVAAGTAWWVSGKAYGQQDSKSPMERLNFACIGAEGKGSSDTDDAGRFGNVVALCDIDERRLAKKATRFPKAQKFVDFRELFEKLGDEIDAVTVSTPDHTHAVITAEALRLGKSAYTQKPLTWSVEESQYLRKLFDEKKSSGVCTQMGNQGTAAAGFREGVESLRAGAIGDATEVHVWTNRPVWPQGEGRPKESVEPPQGLHWDLFLGPAPKRPFHPTAYHPFNWRGWVDFGTGALGDMACHTFNMPCMALSLFDPKSVVAESTGIVEGEQYPSSSTITFQFPERQGMDGKSYPACKVVWYDGGRKPDPSLIMGEKLENSGMCVVGSKGRLYSTNDYGADWVLLPKDDFKSFKKPEPSLPRTLGHFQEFAEACRAGDWKMALSNFDYATRITETILLGNVAMRSGEKIEWDGEKITNSSTANELLGRDYREGWSLTGTRNV